MDKSVAEHIYNTAENELIEKGRSSFATINLMKAEIEKIGRDYLDYFYPDGDKMIFNLKRFKRHFLEERR